MTETNDLVSEALGVAFIAAEIDRDERGITQGKLTSGATFLANNVGVSLECVCKWRKGETKPNKIGVMGLERFIKTYKVV